MGPVLELLASGDEHLRNNISIYSIPMLLRLDTSSLAPLLHRALEPLQGQLAAAQVGQVLFQLLSRCPRLSAPWTGRRRGPLGVCMSATPQPGSCTALPVTDSLLPCHLGLQRRHGTTSHANSQGSRALEIENQPPRGETVVPAGGCVDRSPEGCSSARAAE